MPAWWLVVYTWDVLNGKIAPASALHFYLFPSQFFKIEKLAVMILYAALKANDEFCFLHLWYHLFERSDLSHIWIHHTCMRINKSKNVKKAMALHKKIILSSFSALSSLILFSFFVFSFQLAYISCMWIRVLANRHFLE